MRGIFKFCPLCKYQLRRTCIEGQKRLFCQKCGWIYYDNPLPVVVCAARNRKGEIFIAKRNFNPGKNKWALPGGFVESAEAPEIACLRELREETGLKGKIKKLIGVYLQKIRGDKSLLIIGYEIDVFNCNISLNNELKDAKFFSKKDLPTIPFLSHRKMIEKIFKVKQVP